MCTLDAELGACSICQSQQTSWHALIRLLQHPAVHSSLVWAGNSTSGLLRSGACRLRSMSLEGTVRVIQISVDGVIHMTSYIAGGQAAESPGPDQARRPPDQERGHRGAARGRAAAGLQGARHAGALRRGRRHLHAQAAQGVARPVSEQASPRTAPLAFPLPGVMWSSPSPQTAVHARSMEGNVRWGSKSA